MNEKEFTLEQLKFIYDKQHYFIDRHETMAGKYFTVLTFITGALTLLISVKLEKLTDHKSVILISFGLLFFCFFVSIFKLINTINPLSSTLLKSHEQIKSKTDWVENSFIYYRGIMDIFNSGGHIEYISKINEQSFINDLSKQIYILANYSDIKRDKLEKAKKWISSTLILSGFNLILVIYLLWK